VATSLDQLAYDLSLRALNQQENLLNELRARTGMLLAATAVAASLIGGRILDGDSSIIDVLAMAPALVTLLLSVYVLAPKGHLTFAIDAPAAYEYFMENRIELPEAERDLAYWNREVWEENQIVIDGMIRLFRWACYALVGAVLAWSLVLGLQ